MALRPIISGNANTTRLMRWCKEHENDVCKILTKSEELALRESLKDDPDRLRQELILHNVALVFSTATKYMSATNSFDDLVQRGFVGLSVAASKFNLNQMKTKFATYAYTWVYKYVFDTYWNENKRHDVQNEAISLDSAIAQYASTSKSSESDDDGSMSNYLESHIDPSAGIAIVDTETQMERNAMSTLYADMQKYMLTSDFTDVDRTVFNGAFVENQTLRQISVANDIPTREVKSSYAKILELMKSKLAARGVASFADVY